MNLHNRQGTVGIRIIDLVKFFIDSRLLVSIAAVCLYISTARITDINFDPFYIIFLFSATLATYNVPFLINNRLNRFSISIGLSLFVLLLISCFYAFRNVSIYTIWILLYLTLSTLLYYVPIRGVSLRNVPFLKIFIISANWAVATVLLPILASVNRVPENLTYFLMFERFLFIFAITIPFDIRDIGNDEANKLKTIPMLTGTKNALTLSAIVLFIYLVISFQNYGSGYIFLSRLIVASIVLLLLRHVKKDRHDHFYTGLLDGTMVLQGIFLWGLS